MTEEYFLLVVAIVALVSVVVNAVLLLQIRKMVNRSTATYEELKKVVGHSSVLRDVERERELYKTRMLVLNEIMDLISERVAVLKREEHPTLVSTQLRNRTFNEVLFLVSQRIAELKEGGER